MSIDLISLKASKKYVDETIQGAGGLKGEKGDPGKDGADGFSPIAKVEKTGNTATITIVDKDGPTTVEIKDGEDGRASENTIESISVNGTSLTPDENKNVNIKVPTNTSNLTNDSGFLTEHQDISGKVDKEDGKSLIADTEIERLASVDNYDDSDISARIKTVEDDYVKSEDVTAALVPYAKSADVTDEIISEVAKIVADAPEDFNTLKEMSDWIASHEDDASAMNSAIQANRTDIETLQADKANASDLADHAGNSEIHVTAEDKTAWNKVSDKVDKTSIVTTLNSTVTDEQVASAKSTYDGLKKAESDTKEQFGSASGEAITVNDSVDGNISDLMLFGKSEQKRYSGKNLLDCSGLTEQTINGVTFTPVYENDMLQYINVNGTATSTTYYDLVVGGTFDSSKFAGAIINGCNTKSAFIRISDDSRASISDQYNGVDLTIVDNGSNLYLAIRVASGTSLSNEKIYPMIRLATDTDQSYEPYVGGIQSPNPDYPQEIKSVVNPTVKACGKNLLNKANAEYYIGYSWDAKIQTDWFQAYFNPISSGEYYLNKDVSRFILYDESHNILYGKNFNSRKVIIPKVDNVAYIQFAVWTKETASVEMSKNFFADFMVCKTEEDSNTSYEPYTETTATLPYTLNAIPVSSGGNATIDGQEYIADYVDVEKKRIVRMTHYTTLVEDDVITIGTTGTNAYYMKINYIDASNDNSSKKVISDKFIGVAFNDRIVNTFIDEIMSQDGGITLRTKNNSEKDWSTVELAKEWIRNNPVNILYALNTPTTESLTDEQLADFLELRSYYPTTNVFVTSDQLNGYTTFHYPKTDVSGIVSEHSVEIEKLKKADMDNFNELKQNIENQCKTASDNFISIDTIEGGIEIERIYGKSEQKQYSGKNLFGFGVSVIDKTDEIRTNSPQRLITSKVDDNEVKFSFNGGNYSLAYLVIDGIDGTQDYAISFKVKANTTSYTPSIINHSSLSNTTKLVLEIGLTNQGSTVVDKSQYFILSEIQVERGSDVTAYEPYVGRIPSPNPDYPQEIKSVVNPTVKACGKNLWNVEDVKVQSYGVVNNRACIIFDIVGTYYFSHSGEDIRTIAYRIFDKSKNEWKSDSSTMYVGKKFTITIERNDALAIWGMEGMTVESFNNSLPDAQLECDSYTSYEPYQSEEVTLPYTLNAIPVSSGGNVTIDGQEYIADYVDVERKKIIRYVEKVSYTASDTWNNSSVSDIIYSPRLPTKGNVKQNIALCSHKTNCTVRTTDGFYIGVHTGVTDDKINAWVNSIGSDTVDFYYVLATPIEIDLTDEQIAALYSFESYKDKTHITTEGGMAILDVKYGKSDVAAKAINAERLAIRNNYLEETSDIDFSTEW